MTIADWLFSTMQKLHDAGVDSPRRDALVLLEDTIKKERAWVISHPEETLQGLTLQRLEKLISRRVKREPLAYIRGRAWFYGRFFNVNRDVMIPRPESEAFITLLKEIYNQEPKTKNQKLLIVDVGTGSGCLAITAKLDLPDCQVTAIDNSQKSLKIAKQNAKKHTVKINFLKGDLLQPIPKTKNQKPKTIILANLPYVPEGLITSPEITQEPAEALFSGKYGLDHYRKFFEQLVKKSQILRAEYILIESLESQHKMIAKLAKSAGYDMVKTDVLVQLFKKTN